MTDSTPASLTDPERPLRRWPIRLLQVAVAIGLLIAVWQSANGGEAVQLLGQAELLWLLVAAVLLSGQILLSALRWRLTGERLGMTIPWSRAWREYYLSQVVNQTLPGGVVGDATRAIRSKNTAGLVSAAQSVILERLAGQVALVALLGVGILTSSLGRGGLEWPRWLAVLLIAAVAALLGLVVLGLFLKNGSGRAGRVIDDFSRAASTSLFSRQVRWRQLGLSLGTAAINIAGFWSCAMAVGVQLPLVPALAGIPLILLMMLIPVSVSGWGLREGAAALLFPLLGFSSAEGFATSVAFGLVLIVIALPGLFFLRQRPAREAA